jgi:hypothetical protein
MSSSVIIAIAVALAFSGAALAQAPVPPQLDSLTLSAAEKLDVGGTEATVVLLLDAENAQAAEQTEATGKAILGAMIPLDESAALFVKYKGDAAVARRERDNFNRFVSSIRWQEKQ